jgi:hypothetical protein
MLAEPPVTLRPATMLGTNEAMSPTVVTLWLSRFSPVSAVTATGTSCRRSSFRRDLTMMSPDDASSAASSTGAD